MFAGVAQYFPKSGYSAVGYQNKGLESQFNYVGASFVPVSGDKANMKLGDFSANDACIFTAIQFWTTGGGNKRVTVEEFENVKANYVYWNEAAAEYAVAKTPGWYLEDDYTGKYPQNDIPVPFGTGFIVARDGGEPTATVNFAGQVTNAPVPLDGFASQFNYVGSCCPRDITLGEIVANDACLFTAIQFWTTGGGNKRVTVEEFENVKANYVYWNEASAVYAVAKTPGWYLEDDYTGKYPQNDIKIDAGAGFILARDGGEPTAAISLPGAL